MLPVIAVGELRYGFINGSKPKQNEETLQTFLSTDGIETVDVTITTSNYYAKLYMHTKQHGKVLSSNDLWIAALASQLRMQLITTDGDFEAVRSLLPAGLSIVEV